MPTDQKVDYLELPASDFDAVQSFYEKPLTGSLQITGLTTGLLMTVS